MASDAYSNIVEGYVKLLGVTDKLHAAEKTAPVTVRELLGWFGTQRRDDRINHTISAGLLFCDMRTEPWFADQFTDGKLEFRKGYGAPGRPPDEAHRSFLTQIFGILAQTWLQNWVDTQEEKPVKPELMQAKVDALSWSQFTEEEIEAARQRINPATFFTQDEWAAMREALVRVPDLRAERLASPAGTFAVSDNVISGPWPRRSPESAFPVRRLLTLANNSLKYVVPNDTLGSAMDVMSYHDFSQLPVMLKNKRDVKGVINWRSILATIREQPSSGLAIDKEVKDFMRKDTSEIDADAPLLKAVQKIVENEYALLRDTGTEEIVGIVTPTDLSRELGRLAEPFLLISQIENRIRELVSAAFASRELGDVIREVWQGNLTREIRDVFDLEFGDYVRLLQSKVSWQKLYINRDQDFFVARLEPNPR